jgi:hypothetical protein
MSISPLAGKPAPASMLVDIPKLVTAYYADQPDPAVVAERVAFGTSVSPTRGLAWPRARTDMTISVPMWTPSAA